MAYFSYDYLVSLVKSASAWGYLIVFLLAFFESFAFVGLIIPGSIAVISAGFLAAQGFFNVWWLFLIASLAAILGDNCSFYLGKKSSPSSFSRNKFFSQKLFEKGENYFKRHGSKSVFFGRFIGWIRPVVPFVAGLFKLKRKTFLIWNILSGLLWAIIHIAFGYFFGQVWRAIVFWSTKTGVFLAALIGIIVIFYLLERLWEENKKYVIDFFIRSWNLFKNSVISNPKIRKLIEKHPLFFAFLRKRLEKNNFFGLPLTFLGIAFIYILFLFTGIVQDIISSDPVIGVDQRIANLIVVFRDPYLTKFFSWITLLGKWEVVLVFSLTATAILWIWRKRAHIISFLVVILGSQLFTQLGKIAFHRPRPQMALFAEHSFSFPSGHSAISIAFYGFLIYVLLRNIRTKKTKTIIFSFVILALLIGFSRLYFGVHYFSDVWAGYLIGALWLIIGISLSEWMYSKKRQVCALALRPSLKIIIAFLVIASILFYVGFAKTYKFQALKAAVLPKETIVQGINGIFPKDKLRYTEAIDGNSQEPVSFIIFAKDDKKFVSNFRKAGRFFAGRISIYSITKPGADTLWKKPYSRAPMTCSFWNLKINDFSFEKSTSENNLRQRHHTRFWKTGYKTKETFS